jgi:GAF domain-containing protein
MLGVPLFAQERVIGVFHVGSLYPRHFTDNEAQTMRYVADRIGEVIEKIGLKTSSFYDECALIDLLFNV